MNTPATEDEREALIDLIERARWGAAVAFGRTEVARIPASSRSVADAILAAGFRLRPTPSVDDVARTLFNAEKGYTLPMSATFDRALHAEREPRRRMATAVIALFGGEG